MHKLTWQTISVLAIIAGVIVALATLTKWSPEAIIAIVGVLGGIGGGAAVVGGVSGRVDDVAGRVDDVAGRVVDVAAETTGQSTKLDTISRRVNGELDGRIASAVEKGNDDLLAKLRAEPSLLASLHAKPETQ